jgi:hypothetical protein
MEEKDILQLWKQYDKKLEENLVLNRANTVAITQLKIHSLLASMRPLKIFTILAGVLWVAFLDTLIIHLFPIANPFFLGSAILQVLLTKLSIGIYLYQLVLIQRADISEPVIATQNKLARLKSSTLWVARLLLLQLPVWTTFYWNRSMLENGNVLLYILQAVVTLSFIFLAIWLFRNIKYSNRDKKWFRLLFSGKEWSPVIKSMELLQQVEEYKVHTAV